MSMFSRGISDRDRHEHLAELIRAYWCSRGPVPKVWIEADRVNNPALSARAAVEVLIIRSDMLNGKPRS